MKPLFAAVVVFLAATVVPGAEKSAEQLYKDGQQAERSGEVVRAYLLYSQAAAKDPAEPKYWLRSRALRTRAVTVAKPRPRPVASSSSARQPVLEDGVAERGVNVVVHAFVTGLAGPTFSVEGISVNAGSVFSLAGVSNGTKVEVEGKTVKSMYAPFSFRVKSYNKKPDRKFNVALRIRNKGVYIVKIDKKD